MTQARTLATAAGHVLQVVTGPVTILIDATGIGDAVAEMVAEQLPRDPRLRMISVVLTGGRSENRQGARWSVSKAALVGPTQAAMEQQEIRVRECAHTPALRRELAAYRPKASSIEGGPDRLEAAKESDHDDLVIATCLAVYAARRQQPARVHSPVRVGVPGRYAGALYARSLGQPRRR